ncbi:LapA family protein [Ilumatobacter coccineus]|jgi:uncharacterized integral membrane protein|uniref:Lipopolysaccharide assembly protein A domain-containing protein n=1 Tax=Ilumatobacter coccineus (strain NBRC 103263 / KCTC 29153 / YM16-304) TaxID=1313172 RepID=A0A6C7ECX9_ILUCY|nr:LapA family protein [Ilumatobacter coccineus]BAN01866.1 hypothetical protein YM304_15520 [Ilumatobacter coccineus YM16-304]
MARNDEAERYDEQPGPEGRNGPSVFLILVAVIAIIAGVFILQNREEAQIQFLFFDGTFRVWTAIAFAILLGVLLDRAILMWWRRARRDKD